MREYRYLPLSTVKTYESEMRRLGVSRVARSSRGFLTAYKRAANKNNLSEYWRKKRNGVVFATAPFYSCDKYIERDKNEQVRTPSLHQ